MATQGSGPTQGGPSPLAVKRVVGLFGGMLLGGLAGVIGSWKMHLFGTQWSLPLIALCVVVFAVLGFLKARTAPGPNA